MRYALVINDAVDAVVESDTHPEGWELCGDASPGWVRHASGFAPASNPSGLHIVVTSIEATPADGAIILGFEVTCAVGTVLTVHAELRSATGEVVPATDRFRMPLRSRDGREKVLLASMVEGVISISVPLRESGAWLVTQDMVNGDLPPAAHMLFAGFKVFVVEA